MLGKIEGRKRERQRMWWLDGITDSIDINLSKLQKIVRDREACCAAVPGSQRHNLKTEQLPGRECNPTHKQIIGLKLYWARPCLPEQDPVFHMASPSHQEAYTSLLASSIRGQTEEPRRSTVSQLLKQRPYYRKLITVKKQKVMSQMKGQDKIPEKQQIK